MAKEKKPNEITADKMVNKVLLIDIRSFIESARFRVAQRVNSEIVGLYWHIGKRIREEIIGEGRAEYGQKIIDSTSHILSAEYGKGFSRRNLFNMIRFSETFPDKEIVQTVSAQLS